MIVPEFMHLVSAFCLSVIFVYVTIPPVVRVCRAKSLFDAINGRKLHTQAIPKIGGISIFIGMLIGTIISSVNHDFRSFKYLMAGIILLLFIGLKDDIIVISPRKKLIVEIIAAIILIIPGELRFTNLHGMLGIHELNYPASIIITLIFILGTINAYNLIDGIDGLASGLGIISSAFFGIWFYLTGDLFNAILAFALAGSLAGFFVFNVFGKNHKLFMGDSGALILGFVMAKFVILFIESSPENSMPYAFHAAPALAFALVFVPLFDMIRILTFRLVNKKSPFRADKNHIHHRLLTFMPVHLNVTLTILVLNLVIISLSYFLSRKLININIHFLILFIAGTVFSYIPVIMISARQDKDRTAKKRKLLLNFRSIFMDL